MSDEIMKLRGRLAAAQELAEAICLGVAVDIDTMRDLADKYVPAVELKSDQIVEVSKRIDSQVKRLRTVQAEIESLLKDLGRV